MTITTELNPTTMSSLEIVELINKTREKVSAVLLHKDFLRKVAKVLGTEPAKNFAGQFKAANGEMRKCYNLPKREATLMVMSESFKVQAAIYDRMIELEEDVKALPSNQSIPLQEMDFQKFAIAFITGIKMSRAVGLSKEASELAGDHLAKTVFGHSPHFLLGISNHHLLEENKTAIEQVIAFEDATIDQPVVKNKNGLLYCISEPKGRPINATAISRRLLIKGITNPNGKNDKRFTCANKVNLLLLEMGLIEGESQKWLLTDKGKKYGRHSEGQHIAYPQLIRWYEDAIIRAIEAYLSTQSMAA